MIVVIAVLALGGVCVVGILAAVAIPAFINYTNKAKAAEAEGNVRSLQQSVVAFCLEQGRLPDAAGPVPSVPGKAKQVGDFASDPVFALIGFQPLDPVYYSYRIERPDGNTAVLVARGDLDGDGIQSRYEVSCIGPIPAQEPGSNRDPMAGLSPCSCDLSVTSIDALE